MAAVAGAGAGAEAFDPAAPSPSRAPASRQDVKAAIAKAVELRQLHAALLHRGAPNARAGAGASRSPAVIRLPPVASPARSRTADEEYPVFTPVTPAQAYDDDDEERVGAAALSHICQDNNRSRSENWAGVALDHVGGGGDDDDAALSDYDGLNLNAAFSSSNSEVLFPSSNDRCPRNSRGAAYKIHPAFLC